jgi:hypothetical protein
MSSPGQHVSRGRPLQDDQILIDHGACCQPAWSFRKLVEKTLDWPQCGVSAFHLKPVSNTVPIPAPAPWVSAASVIRA